jgi:hypothetical protein
VACTFFWWWSAADCFSSEAIRAVFTLSTFDTAFSRADLDETPGYILLISTPTVEFSLPRINHVPHETVTTKSHTNIHPITPSSPQGPSKQSRARGVTHIHNPHHHHHQDMWSCGITEIESCRSWLPYIAQQSLLQQCGGFPGDVDTGWNRRQTPPCTWACNIKTGASLPTAFNSIRFLNQNVFFLHATLCKPRQAGKRHKSVIV